LSQKLDDLLIWDRFKLDPELSLSLGCEAVINANIKILKKNLGQVEFKSTLFETEILKLKFFRNLCSLYLNYVVWFNGEYG